MLVELVYSVNAFFTTVPDFNNLPSDTMPLSLIFSLVGAVILGKFTGNMGGITLPLNFSALFLGAMGANWLLDGVQMDVTSPIQEPLFISMVGMVIASLLMMRWLQSDRAPI